MTEQPQLKPPPQPQSKPETTPQKKTVKRAPFSSVLAAFGLLALEILLSVAVAGGLIYAAFAYFNLWQYNYTLAIIVFAGGFVALALLLSISLDSLTTGMRKRYRSRGVRVFTGPLSRLVKLVLGGIILPLAIFAAINFVNLPGRGTVMSTIVTTSRSTVKLTPPDEVGRIALQSEDPFTRVLSIRVLEGFGSEEALAQLIKLAQEDTTALANPAVSSALRHAIASYGVSARDPLIVMFQQSQNTSQPTAESETSAESSPDLYERYFDPSFASLKEQIERTTVDPAEQEAQLKQIEAAQTQLKQSLDELPTLAPSSGDPRPDFALQTLLAMDLKEDSDLLAFARSTAGNDAYPSGIRGDALLLVGKLGSKSDMDWLYPYLSTGDALIQARALQAIAALQSKLAGSGSNNP